MTSSLPLTARRTHQASLDRRRPPGHPGHRRQHDHGRRHRLRGRPAHPRSRRRRHHGRARIRPVARSPRSSTTSAPRSTSSRRLRLQRRQPAQRRQPDGEVQRDRHLDPVDLRRQVRCGRPRHCRVDQHLPDRHRRQRGAHRPHRRARARCVRRRLPSARACRSCRPARTSPRRWSTPCRPAPTTWCSPTPTRKAPTCWPCRPASSSRPRLCRSPARPSQAVLQSVPVSEQPNFGEAAGASPPLSF